MRNRKALESVSKRSASDQLSEYRYEITRLRLELDSALFLEQADILFKIAREYKHLSTLVYIDLDGFKKINDTYGHNAEDILLKAFAEGCMEVLIVGGPRLWFDGRRCVSVVLEGCADDAKSDAHRCWKGIPRRVNLICYRSIVNTLCRLIKVLIYFFFYFMLIPWRAILTINPIQPVILNIKPVLTHSQSPFLQWIRAGSFRSLA